MSEARKIFDTHFRKLKEAFAVGEKFVLFVGAGQNAGKNVHLLWKDLIGNISRTAFRQFFQKLNVSHEDRCAIMRAMGLDSPTEEDHNTAVIEYYLNYIKSCLVPIIVRPDEMKVNFHLVKGMKGLFEKQSYLKAQKQLRDKPMELVEFINTNFPVEIQVSMIKHMLKDHYLPSLQNKMYNEVNREEIKKSFRTLFCLKREQDNEEGNNNGNKETNNQVKGLCTLYTIARMILLNPQIQYVITYNFDNYLRQAIKELLSDLKIYFSQDEKQYLWGRFSFVNEDNNLSKKVIVKDIHDNNVRERTVLTINSIPVYHVHGYIPDPSEENIVESPGIVMALEEFVEQQTAGLSWQDAIQIDAFRNYNIVFIGCSMTDLTMKRMINYAHTSGFDNKIYILNAYREKEKLSPIERQKIILEELKKEYFKSLGAIYLTCPDGYDTLCNRLQEITDVKPNKSNI